MTDAAPALESLPEWLWPKWEFITAIPDDTGITVALAPVDAHRDIAGRMVDSTGHEASFDG